MSFRNKRVTDFESKHCSGCALCVACCPKNCITMQSDDLGYMRPVIDDSLCIDCGLCTKKCIIENPEALSHPILTVAAIRSDEEKLILSSSGGVFAAIAEQLISKGWMVAGCIMDEQLTPRHVLTSNIQVVDDERMPYADDRPIDLLLNSSGAIRRLNPGQLCEVETNFIGEELRKKICQTEGIEAKAELAFKFLDIISSKEATFFRNMYEGYEKNVLVNRHNFKFMAEESKKAFIEDIEKNGFYIVRPPHKPILYKDVMNLYEAFPFIKPIPLYIDLFGIKHRKIIKNGICGTQYVIILKQNSNKNFSARSTFRVNRSNLPAKDVTKKTNRSSYARTPVRLSEIYNLFSSISGRTLAEYNIFMRSSPIGSKSLDRILSADGNPLKIKKLKVRDNYTNSNADILNARLKAIGLAIEFSTLEDEEKRYPPDTVVPMEFNGYTIYDKWYKHNMYQDIFNMYNKMMRSTTFIESYHGQKEEKCWNHIFNNKELHEKYPDDFNEEAVEAIKKATQQNLDEFMRILDENKKENSKNSTTSTEETKVPKKRGRKPKKKYEELVNEVLEANRQMEEEDAEDYEDSPQNSELIEC